MVAFIMNFIYINSSIGVCTVDSVFKVVGLSPTTRVNTHME